MPKKRDVEKLVDTLRNTIEKVEKTRKAAKTAGEA